MGSDNVQTQREFLLEMTDVSKSFPGVKALDNVNLKVRPHSIHALMGENGAGKSTLLKCLFGIYSKDTGSILFQGEEINYKSSKEALENGVSMVHQELNLVLQRTVMDNMWLGRYPKKGFFVDQDKMYRDTKAIFDELDIDIDPRDKVVSLSVSQMQMIEIAKAFSYNAKIVIMDEPTSSLTEKEVNHLFTIIRKLKDRGCGIIYISHKMEEIFQLCDEITILRDGQWIATQPLEGLDMDKIIAMMVGRSLNQRFPDKTNVPGETILEVRNLTSLRQPSIRDISFDLRKGEILGIAGLVGAKRTDIVETLFGIREKSGGTIKLHGKAINNNSANEAINHGFALVTEERRSTGIYAYLDIGFNSLISNIGKYKNSIGLLDNTRMKSDTQWVIDSMRVKTPGHHTSIGSLSGGNQQKVIIGRWLLTQPEILMLDEPTRGIDVGAKFEIYQLISELAKKGKGIIIISSEMPELLGVTDRILVMSNGLAAGIVETKTTTQNEILRLASLHL
ncbi:MULTISPECIES: galactose/methyl galactoside ABC transporter ATP-binding protein MglA [Erwiniaceae]|uniref:Galactose/methyl galactoside ABC transporter ATP-binding protein MglA n=2 Tax=Erwiniaceae TaxID=1903409 RepID=A0ACC5RSW8_ENTAG|nr:MULTISPECIES: galactose/methyl galactoside ABC transporter ATP-binding protein MglA [Erwiniaceae]MBK4727408.1 galactose/methyl galactoside ABC transporter ATP-binding protein MglA [Pantoea agglomerans]MBP2156650.1 methyl-galactoside transport system ATP-binding protein [Erwinia rhapontici]MCS3607647.1 methyl-galactoside transport system ATP-binding protein [Erwinia rhapontici]NKG29710.1 galactose/methyl galactoside ABC transporter ATP-binding protein MglA [Erwinia rhapontici]NNS07548.1 gala